MEARERLRLRFDINLMDSALNAPRCKTTVVATGLRN